MKDIRIKVKGKQQIGEEVEDNIEFMTEGTYSSRNGYHYFLYDEGELFDSKDIKTILKVGNGQVRLRRKDSLGNIAEPMSFAKGKRISLDYYTPYGNMPMEIYTKDVSIDFEEDKGGRISIDYDIMYNNYEEGHNNINIDISFA